MSTATGDSCLSVTPYSTSISMVAVTSYTLTIFTQAWSDNYITWTAATNSFGDIDMTEALP
jgi:hypothetical protein